VPDDLSVVGFDNQEVISAHLHPALSTVGLPQYDLGVLGIRALLQQCSKDGGSSEVADSSAMNSDSRNLGFEPILVSCPVVNRDSIRSLR
jgi:LacI family transcriptional regulator